MAELTLYCYERHDKEVIDPVTLCARSCVLLYGIEDFSDVKSSYSYCGFGDLPVAYFKNQVIAKERIVEFFKTAYDVNLDLNEVNQRKADLLDDICTAKLHPALMYFMWIEKDTPKKFCSPQGPMLWQIAQMPYYKIKFSQEKVQVQKNLARMYNVTSYKSACVQISEATRLLSENLGEGNFFFCHKGGSDFPHVTDVLIWAYLKAFYVNLGNNHAQTSESLNKYANLKDFFYRMDSRIAGLIKDDQDWFDPLPETDFRLVCPICGPDTTPNLVRGRSLNVDLDQIKFKALGDHAGGLMQRLARNTSAPPEAQATDIEIEEMTIEPMSMPSVQMAGIGDHNQKLRKKRAKLQSARRDLQRRDSVIKAKEDELAEKNQTIIEVEITSQEITQQFEMHKQKYQRKKVASKNMMDTVQSENDALKKRLDMMLQQANIGKDDLQKQMVERMKELAEKDRQRTELEKQHQAALDAKTKELQQRADEAAKADQAKDTELKRLRGLEEELAKLKADFALSESGLKKCNEAHVGKDKELDNIHTQLEVADRNLKETEEKLKQALKDLDRQQHESDQEIAALKEQAEKAKVQGSDDPQLQTEMNEANKKLLAAAAKKIMLKHSLVQQSQREDDLSMQIDELEADLANKTAEASEYKRYVALYESTKQELTAADSKIHDLETDLSDLLMRIKKLEHENTQLQMNTRKMATFQKKSLELDRENKQLSRKLANIEEITAEDHTKDTETLNRLTTEINEKDVKIEELEKQLEELQSQAQIALSEKNKISLRTYINRMLRLRLTFQEQAFNMWKSTKSEKLLIDEVDREQFAIEDTNIKLEDSKIAKIIQGEIRKYQIENNEVLKAYNSSGLFTEKPMAYLNIFRFFEDFFDQKFAQDNKDFSQSVRPYSMTSFMMEHLKRMFGLKKLALKQLGQIMPALKQLHAEGQPYATLFCRVLQIIDPEPISYDLALYLTRIRQECNRLVEKANQVRSIRDQHRDANRVHTQRTSASASTHGRASYEVQSVGGEMFLDDVATLIYSIFHEDSQEAELMLQQCKPKNVNQLDFSIFQICKRMAKNAKDTVTLYSTIDKDRNGEITKEEFATGLRSNLHLWITEEDLIKVFDSLDVGETIDIYEFKDIMAGFSNKYNHAAKDDNYIVTKSQFLNACVDICGAVERRDLALGMKYFVQNAGGNAVGAEQAVTMALDLDPSLPAWKQECIRAEGANLDKQAFCRLMLKYSVARYGIGVFFVEELNENLRVSTTRTETSMSVSARGVSVTKATTTETKSVVKKVVRKKQVRKG